MEELQEKTVAFVRITGEPVFILKIKNRTDIQQAQADFESIPDSRILTRRALLENGGIVDYIKTWFTPEELETESDRMGREFARLSKMQGLGQTSTGDSAPENGDGEAVEGIPLAGKLLN